MYEPMGTMLIQTTTVAEYHARVDKYSFNEAVLFEVLNDFAMEFPLCVCVCAHAGMMGIVCTCVYRPKDYGSLCFFHG